MEYTHAQNGATVLGNTCLLLAVLISQGGWLIFSSFCTGQQKLNM